MCCRSRIILQILFMYQQDYLYSLLPPARERCDRRDLCRHLRLRLHLISLRIRGDRDLAAGLVHAQDFIVGLLMFLLVMELSRLAHPAPVLDQCRSDCLHALGLSEPDRFLLASGHELLPRRDVEHGRILHRHLRHLRAARAHADRGLSAAGRASPRLRRAARHDQCDAPPRWPLAPAGAADGGAGLTRHRHDQRLRLGQRRRGRHHHHSADDALWRARHVSPPRSRPPPPWAV